MIVRQQRPWEFRLHFAVGNSVQSKHMCCTCACLVRQRHLFIWSNFPDMISQVQVIS